MLANIAQLVEQRFRKAWVVGSNPSVGSILAGARGAGLVVGDVLVGQVALELAAEFQGVDFTAQSAAE